MKIFPAVHYSMGGLWVDYERTAEGGLRPGLAARTRRRTSPNLYAIGEADYQYHGANRLGANSLLSCIFSGLFVAPGIAALLKSQHGRHGRRTAGGRCSSAARQQQQERHDELLAAAGGRREPVPDPPGTGRGHDQGRHRRPPQRAAARGDPEGRRTARAGRDAARCPTPASGPTRTWCSPRPCWTCSRWPRRSCTGPCSATSAAARTSSRTSPAQPDRRGTGRAAPPGGSSGATISRPTTGSG